MKQWLPRIAGLLFGFALLLLRRTCRIRIHNDPREQIAAQGYRVVFGTLHAHQLCGVLAAEPGTGALVSRSADGDVLVPILRWCGHVPIRGSSGTGRKGGATALQAMIKHVRSGHSAMIAVDGPRGPRGKVQKGIGLLAQKTDAAVVLVASIPSRRWVIRKSWDRFQAPKPFATIDVYTSEPMLPRAGESLEHFTDRIEQALLELEARHDPEEVAAREQAESQAASQASDVQAAA